MDWIAVVAVIHGRIRSTVERIKGAVAYTQAIGEALRIVPSNTLVDPAPAKPNVRVKPLPMFEPEARWDRKGFPTVSLQSQRNGEPDWTDLGVRTGIKHVDARPPVEADKPRCAQSSDAVHAE